MKTTASWWLSSTVDVLKTMGCPVERWFDELGMDFDTLSNPDMRFPQDKITQLWNLAEDETDNASIGLDVGLRVQARSFNVLGYAVASSRTVGEGFSRFLRYQRVIGESLHINLVKDTDQPESKFVVVFEFKGDQIPASKHTVDMAMAACITLFQNLISQTIGVHAVSLQRSPPIDVSNFENLFPCNIEFNSARNTIIIDQNLLDIKIPFANEDIAKQNEALVKKYLLKKPKEECFSDIIIAKIIEALADGEPSKELIAKALNMSSKTLQRKLKNEGENYLGLLNQVRQKMAQELIMQGEVSIQEIAYLLGFSEATNFHRAFKRWFDQTPLEYRHGLKADDE